MKIAKYLIKTFAVLFLAIALIGGVGFGTGEARPVNNSESVEILIGFEKEPDLANIAFIRSQGGRVIRELSQINVLLVEIPERAAEKVMATWNQRSQISFVEENGMMYAHSQTIPWGIERIEAPAAHSVSTGTGIGIAIIDTGIDPRHEDLRIVGGYATVNCFPPARCAAAWDDDHGHGTHVAGTAAALDNDLGVLGVAPNADLYAIKVLDRNGGGTWAGVAEGIIWAAEQDIEVLNMSLGGGHSETVKRAVQCAYSGEYVKSEEEEVEQCLLGKKHSLLISSAGNSGPDEGTVSYPAAYEEVIAVSATDKGDNIASWSSRGEEVELAAPGVNVYSTLPGDKYGTYSGTSMASPHVAGVAALVWVTDSTLTNIGVRGILRDTAEWLEDLSSTEQGYGLVNAAAAVGIEPAEPEPYAAEITPSEQSETGSPGDSIEYIYTVSNVGTEDDTYDLGVSAIWDASVSTTSVSVVAGESVNVTVTHIIPTDAEDGDFDMGTLTATSQTDTAVSDSTIFTTTAKIVIEPEPGDLSIDEFELTNTSNPAWARVTVEWVVSGSNLATVKTEMILNGSVVDSKTSSVSGSSASGMHELRHRRSGSNNYKVILTVVDTSGKEISEEKEINL